MEYINNVIKGNLKNDYIDDIKKIEDRLTKIINKINKSTYENYFNHSYKRISVN